MDRLNLPGTVVLGLSRPYWRSATDRSLGTQTDGFDPKRNLTAAVITLGSGLSTLFLRLVTTLGLRLRTLHQATSAPNLRFLKAFSPFGTHDHYHHSNLERDNSARQGRAILCF